MTACASARSSSLSSTSLRHPHDLVGQLPGGRYGDGLREAEVRSSCTFFQVLGHDFGVEPKTQERFTLALQTAQLPGSRDDQQLPAHGGASRLEIVRRGDDVVRRPLDGLAELPRVPSEQGLQLADAHLLLSGIAGAHDRHGATAG